MEKIIELLQEDFRKILKLRDQLNAEESKVWFREDRISELEKDNSTLRAHIGELQKVIDSFQDMEDRITLTILSRGEVKCINEIVKK